MGFFAWAENIEKIRERWYNIIHQLEKKHPEAGVELTTRGTLWKSDR
jgi:hypothetical protein